MVYAVCDLFLMIKIVVILSHFLLAVLKAVFFYFRSLMYLILIFVYAVR